MDPLRNLRPFPLKHWLGPAAVLLALSLPFASAQACHIDPYDTSLSIGSETFYVYSGNCQPEGCIFDIWIFQEANGVEGLQRCDEFHNDNCECEYGGDTVFV